MLTLTLTLKEKCKSAPKQSIETHSAWFLIPPVSDKDVDWSVFPEDIEFALPDETGFRGFIVEFYNVISGQLDLRAARKYNLTCDPFRRSRAGRISIRS